MSNYKVTLQLTILTPLLLILVIFLMGGGHGYFEPMIFLFPFPSLLLIWFDTINIVFLFIAFIQYPVYGVLVDRFSNHINKIVLYIALIHLITAGVAFGFIPEQFK